MEILFNPRLLPLLLLSILVYWNLRSDKIRHAFLCGISLSLLGYIHPLFSFLMVAICFSLLSLWKIKQKHPHKNGFILVVATLFCCSIIGVGKYGTAAIASAFQNSSWVEQFFIAPLGLSYFAFRLLQYSFGLYRNSIKEISLLKLLTFASFFPTLPAGPMETYQGFFSKSIPVFSWDILLFGVRRTLIGYFKKIVILDFILFQLFGTLIDGVQTHHYEVFLGKPLAPFIYLFISFLRAYLDLSAYSDIAIGLSALFGFRIMENCRFPIFASNLGDFWRRWHISLSNWCRDNVFFPVLVRSQNRMLALLSSMLVMGLWHEASLNRIYWAVYHAGGIFGFFQWEQFKKKRPWLHRTLAHPALFPVANLITLVYVTIGYAFAASEDSKQALHLIALSFKGMVQWTGSFFA